MSFQRRDQKGFSLISESRHRGSGSYRRYQIPFWHQAGHSLFIAVLGAPAGLLTSQISDFCHFGQISDFCHLVKNRIFAILVKNRIFATLVKYRIFAGSVRRAWFTPVLFSLWQVLQKLHYGQFQEIRRNNNRYIFPTILCLSAILWILWCNVDVLKKLYGSAAGGTNRYAANLLMRSVCAGRESPLCYSSYITVLAPRLSCE